MHKRQRIRNRFLNAKSITLGGGLITFLCKVIYDDLKRENSFIKGIFRKFSGSSKIEILNDKNLNNLDSTKKFESDY
jgi:hypothetical protein